MSYGLDLGRRTIRVARGDPAEPIVTSTAPVVFAIDDSHRESDAASPADARSVSRDDTTYAIGSDAIDAADAVDATPRTPFSDEPLLSDDDGATLSLVLDVVLESPDGEQLCYTVPGAPDDDEPWSIDDHCRLVESCLVELGVSPTPIDRGFAVVYDQLEADNYTGLGVCLDGERTNVTLAYYGVPALSFSIPIGDEWVRDRATAELDRDRADVRRALTDFELDPDATTGEIQRALAEAYDDLVERLVDALGRRAVEHELERGLSVPVAVAGEGAVDGLEYLVGGRFDAAALPFSIRGVRRADEPAESVARGALAAAAAGVDGDEGIVRTRDEWASSDSSSSPSMSESPDESESATAASDRATLSFDDERPELDETATDAVDQLFERLGNRDQEIESVRTDVDAVAAAVETLERRTASAESVESLETRLEALSDRVDDGADDLDEVADALDDAVADLEEAAKADEVVALEGRVSGHGEELAAVGDEVSDLADELEELAERVDALESRLADDADARDERVAETVRERLEGTIEDEVARTTAEHVSDAVDDRLEETVNDRLEPISERIGAQADRLDTLEDRTAAHDHRFDRVDASLAERSTSDGVSAEWLEDELEALRVDLEDRRVEDDPGTVRPALVTSALAGAGAAGVVSGGVTAAAIDAGLGAAVAVAGVAVVGTAVVLAR
ncbi:hypothetical protein [Natrarchaeobius oligotrophus]|uniref:Chromosome segregation ATPase n=1 Tax=Natrarchaeobius chitinivorans TaxID=1679083 RepID=A0A3N6MG69_NATCH|nr:hypothetical protein [Natrarchaeobius chitinivorans]RQG99974.1 hypothetical protein EA472_12175 [Natrarchaeobius chitinivorans]